MGALIPITLFGWIPVVVVLFSLLPARKAVIAAYLCAWLFLPIAGYELPGFTNYNKITATTVGVILGALIFDNANLRAFRLSWQDLPMACFCLSPLFSSVANGLGLYDGISGASFKLLTWGLPYFTGRLYFSSLKGMRELAYFMVLGGLVYVPLCLWEVRMSPQLHANVYGVAQHSFDQTRRGGGFRPMVFMHHGLMLSMWMAVCTLCSAHLWLSGALRAIRGVPMSIVTLALFATTILCKSTGATLLLLLGFATLYVLKHRRTALPIFALVLAPLLYVGVRAGNTWDGSQALELAAMVSEDRAGSVGFRLEAENKLAAHAMLQPMFGWGTWGRNFVPRYDGGEEMVVADGLWILVFGTQGFFGLIALLGCILLPVVMFAKCYPPRRWHKPEIAAAAVMATILCLYMLDNLANAMVNPIFMLLAGGLTGVALASHSAIKRAKRVRLALVLGAASHG